MNSKPSTNAASPQDTPPANGLEQNEPRGEYQPNACPGHVLACDDTADRQQPAADAAHQASACINVSLEESFHSDWIARFCRPANLLLQTA